MTTVTVTLTDKQKVQYAKIELQKLLYSINNRVMQSIDESTFNYMSGRQLSRAMKLQEALTGVYDRIKKIHNDLSEPAPFERVTIDFLEFLCALETLKAKAEIKFIEAEPGEDREYFRGKLRVYEALIDNLNHKYRQETKQPAQPWPEDTQRITKIK